MTTRNFIKELARIVGRENVLFGEQDLLAYSYDATQHQKTPTVVVFPRSVKEISEVVKAARRNGIPVIPRGAGTGLSGGTLAIEGGVILELSRMNRIIAIDTANRRAIVEPGTVNLDLQEALAPLGFMYPPDPASQKSCTLGGNVGENAGGPLCFRYGVTSKYVCGMEVVLPTGEVVEFGGDVEDYPGYDLQGLFIGSEGTLGIVTKLILRIVPFPEASRTMLAIFNTLEDSGQAVSDIVSAGIIPAALELMDQRMCWAIEQSVHAGYPVDAEGVLLIEISGLADELDVQVKNISAICQKNNARELRHATNSAERDALWKGRKGAFGSAARISPNYLVNDGVVPRNKLVEALRRVNEISKKHHLPIANVAHAGDGNLHPLILFDANSPDASAAAKKAGEEILETCIALGGTISGEHGIGLEKLAAMRRMFSPLDLAAMREVKRVFDPDNILNPGKLLPPDTGTPNKNESVQMAGKSAGRGREALHQRLAEIVGSENVVTGAQIPSSFGIRINGVMPSVVVFPLTTEQVSQIVKAGNEFETTIVSRGSGSNQQNGLHPSTGDMVLCTSRMKQTIDLDIGNSTVRVEAGKINSELQEELTEHRLFFPLIPFCAETSTIGGELATNASGPLRLMFGTSRDLVLGMTVVTPTGEIINPGGKTMKNVAGIDLCKLFIGSWGTLGIVTEAVLRLFPLPEASQTLCLVFAGFGEAFSAINEIVNSKLSPDAIELVDSVASPHLVSDHVPQLSGTEVLLMIGIEGSEQVVGQHLRQLSGMPGVNRSSRRSTIEGNKTAEVWKAYSGMHQSLLSTVQSSIKGKASVPVIKLEDMFKAIKEVGNKHNVQISTTAHGGSGILYVYFSGEGKDALTVIVELRQAAESMGGFFAVESAPLMVAKSVGNWSRVSAYDLMERLKKGLDPHSILNPGKSVGTYF